ncbi:MAG: acyl-CoA dehydrogenase [Hydrocarboniphaga sp.]|uniref:hypothetical protein n=1 Tax=Hydrocarboniphaga sp. TaxID=2033016 RepID=UPI00262D989D|nr:hypothetical protein [Hydrocarboniphaga sp.]MDB5969675.1 acyl-CoA dehydrogenase [Hydrocarboniphaga sp.]
MSAIDLDHLRSWVGRELRITDPLTPFPARALAGALDHENLPEVGDALPPCWHWIYFLDPARASAVGIDGHPHKGGFLPPVPLPRRMWAAGVLNIAHALRLGVAAEKISTIRSVEYKQGKTGVLVFVNLDHQIVQQGRLCVHEEQNLVYRDMPAGPVSMPAGESAPAKADWSRRLKPDPVLLFRYSALTYNAHRIHYDRDYAMHEEFYPALVVHGPLLVTLLLDLVLREQPGLPIAQFRFRAVRPTFDLGSVQLCGQRDGDTVKLWSADDEHCIGMSASLVLGAKT